jgi:hypothetical protein
MAATPPPTISRAHLARPPYVDPNTNIIYDTDRPEYEGWLTKQSMWLKVSLCVSGCYGVPVMVIFSLILRSMKDQKQEKRNF